MSNCRLLNGSIGPLSSFFSLRPEVSFKQSSSFVSLYFFSLFKRFLSLMKPDEETILKIEQENGLPTQAEFALVSFIKSSILLILVIRYCQTKKEIHKPLNKAPYNVTTSLRFNTQGDFKGRPGFNFAFPVFLSMKLEESHLRVFAPTTYNLPLLKFIYLFIYLFIFLTD